MFICEDCGSTLRLMINREGIQKFIHTLHDNIAIVKAVRCPALPGDRKPKLKTPTIKGNWQCRLCDTRYRGNKQCPRCGDWTSAVQRVLPKFDAANQRQTISRIG